MWKRIASVFTWVLGMLAEEGLLKGTRSRSTGRRWKPMRRCARSCGAITGEAYDEFLNGLAKESGIETPTREQLAKLDRKRPKKGSNDDWEASA